MQTLFRQRQVELGRLCWSALRQVHMYWLTGRSSFDSAKRSPEKFEGFALRSVQKHAERQSTIIYWLLCALPPPAPLKGRMRTCPEDRGKPASPRESMQECSCILPFTQSQYVYACLTNAQLFDKCTTDLIQPSPNCVLVCPCKHPIICTPTTN